jgi:hypothetical protein
VYPIFRDHTVPDLLHVIMSDLLQVIMPNLLQVIMPAYSG